MAVKNVGTLIREARTAKKLSQEQLASEVDGLTGNDVGKAERGEKELTQTHLKAIAKVLGITQKSLLEAPKGGASSTAAKTASTKTPATKKTAAKPSSDAKTSSTAKKTASTAGSVKTTAAKKKTSTAGKTSTASKATKTSQLSTTEQKLIELYRTASSDDKKLATRILKGEKLDIGELLLLANAGNSEDGLLGGLLAKMGLGK